ncbi:MAG: hypothetical protein HKN57_04225 [Xanthomonadales bacterium]|nr:hypothetical protein [Gammaproteobacteria bacterium]MBT8054399.1 hypothetical protein [Gammaproteobacteria bacterium]NND56437.1 hypothetical protein [Xanthomonadales bacterium]NNK51132.1 hypothetical protein [Xanthomonadales bacterium]
MLPRSLYRLPLLALLFCHAAVAQELQTFNVAPSSRVLAILPPQAQVPQPPGPLGEERLGEILQSLEGQAGGEGFILDSKHLYLEGKGYLTLSRPAIVHPESSIVFDNDAAAVLGVRLNVEEGGSYLLDFAVSGKGGGSYTVMTEAGAQEFLDENAAPRRLLVALQAEASGWTLVRLKRTGEGFHLYSVTTTRVK